MVPRPSLGQDWFSDLKKRPDADRHACLLGRVKSTPPTYEADWLDFKVGDDPAIPDKKKLAEEQKKVWSKALSAFANSGGGVLVWGIKAEKDKATRIDAASDYCPVPDVHQFVSRLQELHRQAIEPPVLNVDYLPVPNSATDPSGFVACWIPESAFKPHRAEYVEGKPFFIRAGDNSAPASLALLRYLFHPATNSLINLEVGVSWQANDRGEGGAKHNGLFRLHGAIQNVGTSSAKELLLPLKEFPPGMNLQVREGWYQLPPHPEGHAIAYHHTLHPGLIVPAFTFEMPGKFHPTAGGGIRHIPDLQGMKLIFGVYAADREPQHGAVDFSEDDIIFQKNKNTVGDLGYRYRLPEFWHRFGLG